MSILSRNSGLFKGVTFLLVAFYAISAGRSLLPGFCTTISALNSGLHSIQYADGCCVKSGGDQSATSIDTPPASYATCALCNLTESLTSTVSFTYDTPALATAGSVGLLQNAAPELPLVWTPAALRAPPIAA